MITASSSFPSVGFLLETRKGYITQLCITGVCSHTNICTYVVFFFSGISIQFKNDKSFALSMLLFVILRNDCFTSTLNIFHFNVLCNSKARRKFCNHLQTHNYLDIDIPYYCVSILEILTDNFDACASSTLVFPASLFAIARYLNQWNNLINIDFYYNV